MHGTSQVSQSFTENVSVLVLITQSTVLKLLRQGSKEACEDAIQAYFQKEGCFFLSLTASFVEFI
jgi:hypothetical protein